MQLNKITITKRSAAIIFAVILGTVVALYLGGLFGQLYAGYIVWQDAGGLTGEALMGPIDLSPLFCIPYAFTANGLKGVLFVIVVASGITVYVKIHDRFSSKNFDDRNFVRSDKGTYGTAGWMDEKEMKSVLEVSSPTKAKGIILGEKEGSVISLPHDTHLNKHIAVFGASGTMKSRGFVRNFLFQAIKRSESVIVTDPKAELYRDTAELFRSKGYHVKVFNLVTPAHGDSWNCMSDLDNDTLMAQLLTDVIIKNTGGEKGDHFWDNGESNLLKALILLIDQDPSIAKEHKNLPTVYQTLVNNSEQQLNAIFNRLPLNHPAKAPYSLFQQSSSDSVKTGIVFGLGTRLQVLQSEAIRKITSSSDIDLTEPGKRKCAYFVILSDQEGALDFLSSLFFSFLFIKLVRYADSTPAQRCKVPVNVVFEELSNCGVIPEFGRKLSTIRSRAIQACLITQSLGQLQNRYPNNLWSELVGNCDTQLMLGCTDELTSEFFSSRSGDMTVEVNSTMTVRKTIAMAQVIPQYRQTEGQGKRRLMTPDEILRLPNEELLIIIRGQKMLRANKFDYTGHPYAKKIVPTHITEYQPKERAYTPSIDPILQTGSKEEKKAKRPANSKLYAAAKPPDEF